jgi:hypothetical protein
MLVPLVHPSPRTQGWRSWNEQREDWGGLGKLVRVMQASLQVDCLKDREVSTIGDL